MKFCWNRFNLYLMAALAVLVLCSCSTDQSRRKKALSTFRVHMAINPGPVGRGKEITVDRDHPNRLTVDGEPFLNETMVTQAKVVDVPGGFVLHIRFNQDGTLLLEQYTGANLGGNLAVFSQFPAPPDEKLNQGRWLAAPRITTHISDGLLAFTPDMSRDEADQLVLGLNNLAKKLKTGQEFKW